MLNLNQIHEDINTIVNNDFEFNISCKNIEEKVRLLIFRDLFRLNWTWKVEGDSILCSPPEQYDKWEIKRAMAIKRKEIIDANSDWIKRNINLARTNLADGVDAFRSEIKPIIEEVKTKKQHDLFRIYRYYWSSPYSEYVGRRIRLIIRDSALPQNPVIGIAALGSPIIHIPARDQWVGWDTKTRTMNLNYTMDAYVIGALPPYNYLLGGKLISYILSSKEVRNLYEQKYSNKKTIISGMKRNILVGIFTTSLYGKSSQYNKLKFNDQLLYIPIGATKGFGTLHLTKETFSAMQEYLRSKNLEISNNFGAGPIWTMRLINKVGELLKFDPDFLLKHSFKRGIYFIPYAENAVDFLNNRTSDIRYYDYTTKELINFWKKRWLYNRKNQPEIINKVINFDPKEFIV